MPVLTTFAGTPARSEYSGDTYCLLSKEHEATTVFGGVSVPFNILQPNANQLLSPITIGLSLGRIILVLISCTSEDLYR